MVVNNMADTLQSNENDPRKTKLGDFLRRTNLDELPQLFNIFRGEMSFVGPRPHMIKHTEEFYQKYDKYMVRHWVKPGLTGWAQVNGWRGDSDIEMRVKFDIEYIENWTFFWDIKIIFLTIFGKKARNHAY
jgi:putative colanic acid biosynthesis UDP-glucose lipid carrier transferase